MQLAVVAAGLRRENPIACGDRWRPGSARAAWSTSEKRVGRRRAQSAGTTSNSRGRSSRFSVSANTAFPESRAASFALLVYVRRGSNARAGGIHPRAAQLAADGFYSPSQLTQDLRRHHGVILPADVLREPVGSAHWRGRRSARRPEQFVVPAQAGTQFVVPAQADTQFVVPAQAELGLSFAQAGTQCRPTTRYPALRLRIVPWSKASRNSGRRKTRSPFRASACSAMSTTWRAAPT